MKKALLIIAIALIPALTAAGFDSGGEADLPAHGRYGSQHLGLQFGFNSYRPTEEPFETLPFPFGLSLEQRIGTKLGIGGTVMYDRWCDYLGMFGGKYAFQVFKPSFDVSYHLRPGWPDGLDLFAGAHLGYSFFWVTNELGNDYEGELRHEPHIAPFIGTTVHFGKGGRGLWSRLGFTARAAWSVTGRLAGVYGSAGIVLRLK